MSRKPVLLVRPGNIYGIQTYPPLGLILVGTALAEEGFPVEILTNDDGDVHFKKKLLNKAKDALFVGITATTAEIQDAIGLARAMRSEFGKKVPLVWGGWHTTLFPQQMAASDLVDFAVPGEGEKGMLEIAMHLSQTGGQRPLNGKVVDRSFIDLDELHPPRYDLLPNIESYITRPLNDKFLEYYEGDFRWLPYESSRGCPFPCAFCINSVTGNRKYRAKSAKKTAREIADLVTKYRLTHVKIIDDLFFVKIDRVREIFEETARLGVTFTWDAECRVDFFKEDFMDDKMFAFLKKNGLVELTFGIESGSLDTLRRMRKGGKAGPKFAIAAIEMCAKHGVASRGSFILDIPGDKPEHIMETVELIRKLRRYPKFACGVHTYRPYPRSPLCEQLIREGKFYQPTTLEGWEDNDSVRQFTDTAVERVWQANYKLSSKVSFYESLESGFWIKPHQLSNPVARFINQLFIKIACLRNRHKFYAFAIDKAIYIKFKNFCIKHLTFKKAKARQNSEQHTAGNENNLGIDHHEHTKEPRPEEAMALVKDKESHYEQNTRQLQ